MLLSVCLLGREGLDGPEVGGMVRAGEVILRDSEVAFYATLGVLGVTDKEHAAFVVIAGAIRISLLIISCHPT